MGAGFFTWVGVVFVAGSSDRVTVAAGIPYTWQIAFWRGGMFVLPFLAAWIAYRIASGLRAEEDRGTPEAAPPCPGD